MRESVVKCAKTQTAFLWITYAVDELMAMVSGVGLVAVRSLFPRAYLMAIVSPTSRWSKLSSKQVVLGRANRRVVLSFASLPEMS
jgi:hypothetical protein